MRVNELHAGAKQVQRSSGRSSVAAAAYRSGELIVDERPALCLITLLIGRVTVAHSGMRFEFKENRALLILEQEDHPDGYKGNRFSGHRIATLGQREVSFVFHEKQIEQAQNELTQAKERLESLQQNIRMYEADKRLEEISAKQIDDMKRTQEAKARDQSRANDNPAERGRPKG